MMENKCKVQQNAGAQDAVNDLQKDGKTNNVFQFSQFNLCKINILFYLDTCKRDHRVCGICVSSCLIELLCVILNR